MNSEKAVIGLKKLGNHTPIAIGPEKLRQYVDAFLLDNNYDFITQAGLVNLVYVSHYLF